MNNSIKDFTNHIHQHLLDHKDEKTLSSSHRFFKEKVNIIGVKMSVVTTLSKQLYKQIEHQDKNYIFDVCDELWQTVKTIYRI